MATRQIRNRVVGLRQVRAGDLVPHELNWRTHPDQQRRILQGLLDQVGYADALIAYPEGERLVVIDGHLRRSLDPDQMVPVLEVDLTAEEARLVLATLDPVAGLAGADPGAVAALHAEVQAASEDVRALLASIEKAAGVTTSGLTDPDDIPVAPEPRSRPGEVWELGEHTIVVGDATQAAAWSLLGDMNIEAVWTDPPFGVAYAGKTRDALRIVNDRASAIPALLDSAFRELDRRLAPGASLYVAHPSTGELGVAFAQAFLDQGWRIVQELVWVKDRFVLGRSDYHFQHEGLIYGRKPSSRRLGRGRAGWYGGNAETSVFQIARPSASREHPTAKPVALVSRCLANSTVRGAVVADPFLGSGTTLIACQVLGRRCVGIELDPTYVDVAIARWERFTGQVAVRRV